MIGKNLENVSTSMQNLCINLIKQGYFVFLDIFENF